MLRHGEKIGVVMLDIRIVHIDGRETLEGIREFNPELPVCLMGDAEEFESSDLLVPGGLAFCPQAMSHGRSHSCGATSRERTKSGAGRR